MTLEIKSNIDVTDVTLDLDIDVKIAALSFLSSQDSPLINGPLNWVKLKVNGS